MKFKRIIFVLIFLLFQSCLAKNVSEEQLSNVFEYTEENGIKNEIENQLKLDATIEKQTGTNFIYTDLKECLNLALNENYDIKINTQIQNEKLWNSRNAKLQILPDIHYDYTWQKLRGEFLVGGITPMSVKEMTMNSYFNIEWPVFNKGLYFFNMIIAGKELKKAKAGTKYSKDETLYKTSLAYYDTLESKLQIDSYRMNVKELKEYRDMTDMRHKAGVDKKYDVMRAEADYEKAETEYTGAIDNLRLKQAILSNIVGIEVMTPLYPFEVTVQPITLLKEDYTIDELYFIATSLREDIKAKQAEIEANIIRQRSYISDFLPDVRITYQDGYAGTASTGMLGNTTFKINASIYLGEKLLLGTATKMQKQKALIESQKFELENMKRNVKEKIFAAYLDAHSNFNSIKSAEKELEAAEESLRLAIGSYKAGVGMFTHVLDAQTIKTEAKLGLINKIINYNKAQIQLLFETGLISLSGILCDYKGKN